MKRLVGLVFALSTGMIGAFQAQAQSAYGCSNLAGLNDMPVIEGRGGVFFRIHPDMHNFYPFSDDTVDQVGELSEALAATGTTLIYLPVPTKSLAMPGFLTAEAEDFGFDADMATTVYLDIVKRLEQRGVATADVRKPMIGTQFSDPAFFQADHRWTPAGARLAAQAVATRLAQVPEFSGVAGSGFTSAPSGSVTLESDMFAQIQQHCQLALPPVITASYATARSGGVVQPGDNSIFGSAQGSRRIAVVGTEFTGEPASNFAGFLSESTGLDVVQYNVTDGGAFGAISSYLTSDAFQTARPSVLIWEVPVEANLAQWGDQPMRELIAAGGNTCRVPLNLFSTGAPNKVSVDLNSLDAGLDYTLFVDGAGATSPEATFTFKARNGETRSRTVIRHPDQRHTGRFAMPMSGLWPDGVSGVEIELSEPFGSSPRVVACFYAGKG
ncbi:alginate O-acetyltransferase AlgX-related protein [Oceaniglobus ichthyenteri]|uniref:alginate O-acetyltransferase AlgX-related protein n=1 Tax=Oceaniglobus ichthyenteri TaxID=2136177 RepID=UPI000D384308|nr:hypothetical protein [Oceaniglobus ichthyenteri]